MTENLSSWDKIRAMVGNEDPLVIVSVSGGRDSAAASLHLKELGVDHERVFADTGWEHQLTYDYLRGPLTASIGPIAEVRGRRTFKELIRHRGMFPSRTRRFCTVDLKVEPLKRYIAERSKSTGRPVVSVIGIRRQESVARSRSLEVDGERYKDGTFVTVWRPLVDWSADDVAAIHARHGLEINPLYGLGSKRVGCWPCINSSKGELRLLGQIDPGRVAEIAELEAEVQATAEARYAAKGSTFESLGFRRPTFFAQIGTNNERENGTSWPIERVMAWARTSRGGRQYAMDFDSDGGCVRWGLCERED